MLSQKQKFSVGRIQKILKEGGYSNEVGPGASIYLAAALGGLCEILMRRAAAAARGEGHPCIQPEHIQLVLEEASTEIQRHDFAPGRQEAFEAPPSLDKKKHYATSRNTKCYQSAVQIHSKENVPQASSKLHKPQFPAHRLHPLPSMDTQQEICASQESSSATCRKGNPSFSHLVDCRFQQRTQNSTLLKSESSQGDNYKSNCSKIDGLEHENVASFKKRKGEFDTNSCASLVGESNKKQRPSSEQVSTDKTECHQPLFSCGQIKDRTQIPNGEVDQQASVFLGAAVEALCSKVLSIAAEEAKQNSKIQITAEDIHTALQSERIGIPLMKYEGKSLQHNIQPRNQLAASNEFVCNADAAPTQREGEISAIEYFVHEFEIPVEDVKTIISRHPNLERLSVEKRLKPIVQYLRERIDLNSVEFTSILLRHPTVLTASLQKNLEPTLKYDTSELQLHLSSIKEIVLKQPLILSLSLQKNIKPKINFFMNIMGATKEEIVKSLLTDPRAFGSSLEGRIIPRFENLKQIGVNPKLGPHLYVLTRYTDDAFQKWLERQPRT